MDQQKILDILQQDMKPAFGVTEPAALALACAKAHSVVGGDLKRIRVKADAGTYKNGYACGIPGTNDMGNELAAILGVICGKPELELQVLAGLTESDISRAKTFRTQGIARIELNPDATLLLIDARVETSNGVGRAIIKGEHANIIYVGEDSVVDFNAEAGSSAATLDKSYLNRFLISDFVQFIDKAPEEKLNFTLDAVEMNHTLAEKGNLGGSMKVGETLQQIALQGGARPDLRASAEILTSRAVDARMGGVPSPAMSIGGSGDHGIVATLPVYSVWKSLNLREENLKRALTLSILVTLFIKNHSGLLSAFCGAAIAAGSGASAAITWLMGGREQQIGHAINNMAANITGMICDGGNFGCSLKTATAAGAAVMSAAMAVRNVVIPDSSGIVGRTPEETMRNLGRVASPGMVQTNAEILRIMTDRNAVE